MRGATRPDRWPADVKDLDKPGVAVAPNAPDQWVLQAVADGGARVVAVDEADALVWNGGDSSALAELVDANPGLRWVQLPTAGIEAFTTVIDDRRIWTCAKGAFSPTVAEHALALILALLRNLGRAVRATEWSPNHVRQLAHSRVVIVGAGGIGVELQRLLEPFNVSITFVRNTPQPVAGATRTVTVDTLRAVLPDADVVVLALPLTPEARGLVGEAELRAMTPDAILVNVARGAHIVTGDLVRALAEGWIAGAGLDVTDPEPLPAGHPLWTEPRCIITSHSANSASAYQQALGHRIRRNVELFRQGRQDLLGVIEPSRRY